MRKLIWTGAMLALLAGVYWSVAHATVHPNSPVGRAFSWFGLSTPGAPPTELTSIEPATCHGSPCGDSAAQTIHVQAHKPAGLIVIQPDFTPMPDPDGNEALPSSIVRSEPVREVVVPEEFRIMPEVESAEEARPVKERNEVTVGIKLSAECPCCPLDILCQVKVGECCRIFSFANLYSYLHGKTVGTGCPIAACQKAIACACGKECKDCPACCKEGCKQCPVGCKQCPVGCKQCPAGGTARVERLTEPPVEVEESEPVRNP